MAPIFFKTTYASTLVGFKDAFFITTLEPFEIAAATAKKNPLEGSAGTVIFKGFRCDVRGFIFIKPSLSVQISAPIPFNILSVWSRVSSFSLYLLTFVALRAAKIIADLT